MKVGSRVISRRLRYNYTSLFEALVHCFPFQAQVSSSGTNILWTVKTSFAYLGKLCPLVKCSFSEESRIKKKENINITEMNTNVLAATVDIELRPLKTPIQA